MNDAVEVKLHALGIFFYAGSSLDSHMCELGSLRQVHKILEHGTLVAGGCCLTP